jgi:hypothetical protein
MPIDMHSYSILHLTKQVKEFIQKIRCGKLGTQTEHSIKAYVDFRGMGGWVRRGGSLVSKVADEANSELLNTEEVSKPNSTPALCFKSPKLKSN